MPTEKFDGGTWPHPARLPLGCGWAGRCTAPGHENIQLSADELHQCNLGYAEACSRLPQHRRIDSVRFAIKAAVVDEAAARNRSAVELIYVCERQHRPVEHGTVEFDQVAAKWLRTHEDPRIQTMAECFLETMLARQLAKNVA